MIHSTEDQLDQSRRLVENPSPTFDASLSYEELLDRDPRWAMNEGGRHFEEESAVFKALRDIALRLSSLGIPYAVVGGMALFRHGLRRFTEDVDILVTKKDLKIIHEKLEGLGYLQPFANSKHLRDTQYKVKIEFLTTGDFPGDGKPKPVAFPDPRSVSAESNGVSYVDLPTLIELKLASGMTNPGRLKDLSDVLELIKVLDLPIGFVEKLNPYVGPKFEELWNQARKRFIASRKSLGMDPERSEELLQRMLADGVRFEEDGTLLATNDSKVADKYGMLEESEFWVAEYDAQPDGP